MNPEEGADAIRKRFGIVGRRREIAQVLSAISANKHVLLEGPVGVGKTTVALGVTRHLNRRFYRVDGDERYTEQKLVGWFDPPMALSKGYTEESFIRGPLAEAMEGGSVLFINELNRLPEGTQNVLLPAMDERQIVIPRIGTVAAKEGFIIIATQNPEEFVGTSRLSEALRDRFVWVNLDYQPEGEEREIVRKETGCADDRLVALGTRIARKTREHPKIRRGSSIRGAIDFVSLLMNNSEPSLGEEVCVEAAVSALVTKIEVEVKDSGDVRGIIRELVRAALGEIFGPSIEGGASHKKPGEDGGAAGTTSKTAPKQHREGQAPFSIALAGADRDNILKSLFKVIDNGYPSARGEISEDALKDATMAAEKAGLGWSVVRLFSILEKELSPELRDLMERRVARIIQYVASRIAGKGIVPYTRRRIPFSFGAEEMDLEETLENCLGKRQPEPSDIVMIGKKPKKRAVALMLDTSKSMTMEKIAVSVLAVATLAHILRNDYYSIMCFNSAPQVIKAMEEEADLEVLIPKLLELETGGTTNIRDALEMGAAELSSVRTNENIFERFGVLATDCWATSGGEPREVAHKFQKLNVVQVGTGGGPYCDDLARDLAFLGGGAHVYVSEADFDDLPYALMKALRWV